MLNLKVWKTWPKSRIYNIILQNDKEELLKRFKSTRGRNRKPVKITDLSEGKEYIFKTSKGAADFLGLLAPWRKIGLLYIEICLVNCISFRAVSNVDKQSIRNFPTDLQPIVWRFDYFYLRINIFFGSK